MLNKYIYKCNNLFYKIYITKFFNNLILYIYIFDFTSLLFWYCIFAFFDIKVLFYLNLILLLWLTLYIYFI